MGLGTGARLEAGRRKKNRQTRLFLLTLCGSFEHFKKRIPKLRSRRVQV